MLIPKTLGLYLVYFPSFDPFKSEDRLWLSLIDPSVPSSSRADEVIVV